IQKLIVGDGKRQSHTASLDAFVGGLGSAYNEREKGQGKREKARGKGSMRQGQPTYNQQCCEKNQPEDKAQAPEVATRDVAATEIHRRGTGRIRRQHTHQAE